MQLTYMVRGWDGKEYGPVTLEQLNDWARESRLTAEQSVKRSDMEGFAPARDFTELQTLFPSGAPATAGPATLARSATAASANPAAVSHLKSGASWFYWIAALSLINSISAASGSSWRFIIGLGITQIFDELGSQIGSAGRWVALGLDLLAAGMFVLFGVFAHKGHQWPFIVGMVLFALDGLIFVLATDWLGIAFHAFILYCLFRGFRACRVLRA